MQEVYTKLKPRLQWQKKHSTRSNVFTKKLDLNLRNKLVKCYIWSIALYEAETWTLRKVDGEIPGRFRNVVLEKDREDQLERSFEK
jgi:hypothetical protein